MYVAGGQNRSGFPVSGADIIHLNRNPLIPGCNEAPEFPIKLSAAVASILDESVRVCGGVQEDGTVTDVCR